MSETPSRKLLLPLAVPADESKKPLPSVLSSPVSRGSDGEGVKLIEGVSVLASYELAGVSRSSNAPESHSEDLGRSLLALEAEDGSTLFIRSDRLLEDIERLCPEALTADGQIDFARFRERDGVSRGGAASWIWKRLSVLSLDTDEIIERAQEQAKEWLGEKLADKLGQEALLFASTLGAKALMQAIESQLAGTPGLYRWRGTPLEAADLCREGDARFKDWDKEQGLLFIHGTGSHTFGGFRDLPSSMDWPALCSHFGDRVFGFEHRTFSQSPIENALALATVLPQGARICLVTHSRGGLVGDLLCLGSFSNESRRLIDDFRRKPRPDELEKEEANPELRTVREQVAAEERKKLGELVDLLAQKSLRIERYVRVACPAAGTALLSDNLEVFLSGLLNLIRKLGSWGAGAAVGALASPVAGKAAADVTDKALKLLSRVVLEIADKRLQAQVVPGIEAMLPDSPLGSFLVRAPRASAVQMAVIAGDIEEEVLWKRIGVMFTDWMFFDQADNDLVVDTGSMYQGLAAAQGAHALFDQGPGVNHFNYFRNSRTRSALREWLLTDQPTSLKDWTEMPPPRRQTRQAVLSRGAGEPPKDNSRPVLIYLPGIMGSHLEVARKKQDEPGSGDRVWLDPLDLASGGLKKIARNVEGVLPEDILDLAYGDLARHLEASHRVIRFPYDWRLEIRAAADSLASVLEEALRTHPDQPVRLLAHSMGGLVVRTMIARKPDLWKRLMERPGGRLLMLGTPNHGSHLFVETLLGKSDTIRMLARVDQAHSMQEVLEIVAGFPGALQLLPRPNFRDTGGAAAKDYYAADTWPGLAAINNDFWFGKKLGGKPKQGDLDQAKLFWNTLGDPEDEKARIGAPERVAYVYGQADNTPCGIRVGEKRLEMLGTPHGDGSVTWASSKLDWLPEERCWMMPADHAGLVNSPEHFEAIGELLATGATSRLGRLPTSRGAVEAETRPYQPGPMPGFPTEAELVARLVGGHSRVPRPRASRRVLSVGVRAMDLRFAQHPILCGHYQDDPISGPEAVIDQLVNCALSRRQSLGVHAGPIGSASVVLMPRGQEDILRGTGRGALVVGLGEMGKLTSREITETVRAGVLRLLLHADDRAREESQSGPLQLKLASLLIGFNSTINISLEESVRAITLGVLEANRQFAQGYGPDKSRGEAAQVARLEFLEMYRDAAITAAHAVSGLPTLLVRELKRLGMRIQPDGELNYGKGTRPRLSLAPSANYWPRLVVSGENGSDLKYIFLGQRARAETVVQLRQPGLVESLVKDVVAHTSYSPGAGIGNTLFHLLIPLDFKAAARETPNLLLALDNTTANIPWEMLELDGEPLVLSTRMVRQLVSTRFRSQARTTRNPSALLVVNPDTRGYHAQVGKPDWAQKNPGREDRLPSLPGSVAEAEAVKKLLEGYQYQITEAPSDSLATDVFGKLFAHPYRILMVSGHGVHQVQARDGSLRSGVVLSDGLLLTAAEVKLMEAVPELVFLNCCHLGKMESDDGAAVGSHHLAYSLACEFIKMGVRCVVASGWEVDDEAGSTFAQTFFEHMVGRKASFGQALYLARKEVIEMHPGVNTWGAYQAYGDPDFRLEIGSEREEGGGSFLAPDELLDWLEQRRLEAHENLEQRDAKPGQHFKAMEGKLKQRLADCPAIWLDRPEIQQGIGLLYGEYGEAGFEKARAALGRAIAEEAKQGTVAIAGIEQLANFETRQAEHIAGDASRRAEAQELVGTAIRRLENLLAIAGRSNAERQSLLGSALKRKAVLLLGQGASWITLQKSLAAARDAYQAGEGHPDGAGFNPYALINRLQLDALLGTRDAGREALVGRCQDAARKRFRQSYDFWDGVMAADAALVPMLVPGARIEELAGMEGVYRDAVKQISASARQFDSVVAQLCILARFIQARGGAGDGERAQALAELAQKLDPGAAPCPLNKEPSAAAPVEADQASATPDLNKEPS